MTAWLFLFCIICIPTCLCSSSSSREEEDKKYDVLEELMDYIFIQKHKIDDLQNQIDSLKMELGVASIIPPNLALNIAICRGREPGISSGQEDADLRCPSQSIRIVGPHGENDRDGTGLVGAIGEGKDGEEEFTMIEQCEAECLKDDRCLAFNWFQKFQGNNRCELYGELSPDQLFNTANPLIFCRIEPLCRTGDIITIAGTVPDGYELADGSPISLTQYPALCEILGVTDGSECDLPDLRGKFVIGAGDGRASGCKGIDAPLGECGGDETLDIF